MSNKLMVFICIIALSATLALGGFAQDAPPKTEGAPASGGSGGTPPVTEKQTPVPPKGIAMNLGGPQIGTFLELIASRENKLIMYDDNANALKTQKINVLPESFIVPADKYDSILNSIIDAQLRMRGYVLLRTEPVWKIVRIEQARENPGVVGAPADIEKLPTDDRVVTQVIQFKFIEAQAFSTYMAALRGKGMENSYIIIPENNTVVVTDYASNIRRYWEIAKTVDQEGVIFQTETRQLKNTSATMVKTNLDTQYIPLRFSTKPRGALPSAQPRVFADDRTNSLIIIAQEKDMTEMLKIINVFDAEAPKKENEYYIYKLTNTNAADVQKILDAVFKQPLSTLGPSIKASEKTLSIQADISSNSLIISAPRIMYDEMLELIKKIDIKKMQVLLEVVIAELTDEKMTQLGIELASVKQPGSSVSGFGGSVTGISTLDPTTGGRIPIIPDATEKGIGSMTLGLWKGTQTSIPFLMQAAQKDTGINLKAAPVLLANDNTEASIDMSDKAPFFTTSYPGGVGQPATTSFSGYVEAKISLKITPVINSEDNYIRLSIEQTSEQFLGEPDQKSPKTSRTAKTVVTVPDRDTVVIGGLTREVTSKTVSKVPLLGDIPLLGYLFRRETDSVRKYHLCLFIKPNIMRDFSDLLKETKATEKALEDKKKNGILKEDSPKKQ
jgi:general secretion pathway protein D